MTSFNYEEVISEVISEINSDIAARMQVRVNEKLNNPNVSNELKQLIQNIPTPSIDSGKLPYQSALVNAIFAHLEAKIPEVFRVKLNPEYNPGDPNSDQYILVKRIT